MCIRDRFRGNDVVLAVVSTDACTTVNNNSVEIFITEVSWIELVGVIGIFIADLLGLIFIETCINSVNNSVEIIFDIGIDGNKSFDIVENTNIGFVDAKGITVIGGPLTLNWMLPGKTKK